MFAATSKLAKTMTGGRMLGTMCLNKILELLAPRAFEACTNSSSLTLSISPLATRAIVGQLNTARMSIISVSPNPLATSRMKILAKSRMITRTGRTRNICVIPRSSAPEAPFL